MSDAPLWPRLALAMIRLWQRLARWGLDCHDAAERRAEAWRVRYTRWRREQDR